MAVSDNFNRTDGALGANWTAMTGAIAMQIVSNAVGSNNPGNNTLARYSGSSFNATQTASITLTGDNYGGVGLYGSGSGGTAAGYYVVPSPGSGSFRVYKVVAGSHNFLADRGDGVYSAGNTLELRGSVSGSTVTLKVYLEGAQVGADITDSSSAHTTGAPIIYAYTQVTNQTNLDNFNATGEAAAGSTITPDAGTLTVTGNAPTRFLQALAATVVGAVAFSGNAPTATVFNPHQSVAPAAASVTITGNAPTLVEGLNRTLSPAAGALTVEGQTIAGLNIGVTLAPAAGTLTFTGQNTSLQFMGPDVGALTFTGTTPTVVFGGNPLKQPAAGSLSFGGLAPSVDGGGRRGKQARGRGRSR